MKLLTKRPTSRFFKEVPDALVGKDLTRDENKTFFAQYKSNNQLAFRAIYEIIVYNGDISKCSDGIQTVLDQPEYFYLVGNNKILGKKLQQFAKAWPELAKNFELEGIVQKFATNFHALWTDYTPSIRNYNSNASIPLYLDIADYLQALLDDDGKLKTDNTDVLEEYADLAGKWRSELNAQHQKLKEDEAE